VPRRGPAGRRRRPTMRFLGPSANSPTTQRRHLTKRETARVPLHEFCGPFGDFEDACRLQTSMLRGNLGRETRMAGRKVSTPSVTLGAAMRSLLYAAGLTVVILLVMFRGDLRALAGYASWVAAAFGHPHAPDLSLLAASGAIVLVHVAL